MFGKGGSAVLHAPEENYAPETEWTAPEPAPPGTLHHRDEVATAAAASRVPESEPWPAQSMPGRYRLRVGVPSSTAGRIAMAAGALFVLGVLGSGLIALRYSILHDDRFVLAASPNIEIEGNHHLTRAQIVSVFASDMQRNVFRVPLAERQADLSRLPWAERVTVMRLMPDHVRVQVAERTPVAFVRQGSRIGLVDASGVLLDMPQDGTSQGGAGDSNYSFPVLTGVAAGDPLSARAARMDLYKRFMQDLDSSGPKFTQNLSEVDVSDPEDVKALIASGSTDLLVHFGYENFLQRYRLFEQNLPQWKKDYPKLAAVDTRYENQMVLEMEKGTPAPLAEARIQDGKTNDTKTNDKPAAKAGAMRKPTPHHSAPAHGPVKR